MIVTTIRSRTTSVCAACVFSSQPTNSISEMKRKLSLRFLKLSLSRFACFFVWFRVRDIASIGVSSFFSPLFLRVRVDAIFSSFLFPRLVRFTHISSRFPRRFYASLRFFFLLFYIYIKKNICKLILSRERKKIRGLHSFLRLRGREEFSWGNRGCVMRGTTVRTLWRAIRGRQPPWNYRNQYFRKKRYIWIRILLLLILL